MAVMLLLSCGPLITFRIGGSALLLGLTAGAMLVGGRSVAGPTEFVAASRAAATLPLAPPIPSPAIVPPADLVPVTPAPTATPRPTPRATPTPTRAAPVVDSDPAADVVRLTNDARADAGCAALRPDSRLTAAAQDHSADMASQGYFSHDSQDGRGFADRITAAGHPSPGGENIAQGQWSAAEVVQARLDSPGHRRNIEGCSFATIGVGLAGGDHYRTQDFGR